LLKKRGLGGPLAGVTIGVNDVIGTMYLFPGLWKLWEGGDLWITGQKLEAEQEGFAKADLELLKAVAVRPEWLTER
jgi:hypothetical protein